MNKKILLTISILFMMFLTLYAENAELVKLKSEKKESEKKVIEKYEVTLKRIDDAYLKKLKELMTLFMKKADLDGAVAVREELNAFRKKMGISENKKKEIPKEVKVKEPKEDEPEEPEEPKEDEPEEEAPKGDKVFGEEEF